jgi:hypothetical protein
VIPVGKGLWRRRELRRKGPARQRVLAAYRVFDGEIADVGLGRHDGETLEEQRARLSALVAFSDGHLGRLTDLATRAAYSGADPSDEDADRAVEDARKAASDVRRSVGLGRRIVGVYRPGL